MDRVYLTRRNLEVLLAKLDRTRAGDPSACTIIKTDNIHPVYPQTMDAIQITAVEDDDYYTNRPPGRMDPKEDKL